MTRPRADIDTFSVLLESVYESATDPDHWGVFLQGLARALNAKSGMFRVIDERVPAVRANIHYNLDPELQKAHREYYVTRDVFIEALREAPDVYITPGERYLALKDLQRTEFFADYMQPQDSYHVCGGLAMRNEEFTIKFGLQRDRRTGPFSEDDATFIRRFVPHVRRAARISHLLDLAEQQTATAEQALESLAVGILLLDDHDRVIHSNEKAEQVLLHRRGLTHASGRLAAVRETDAERLRHLLAAVRTRTRLAQPPIPEAMLLTPGVEDPQLLLVACPVPPSQSHFSGPWPRVNSAVFISNLDDAGLLNHDILVTLYGLTAAEARLACALSRGHDLADLSDAWGIARETLRTHLKRVLAKTGTSRQAELVRLLTGKPWNLVHDGAPAGAVQ